MLFIIKCGDILYYNLEYRDKNYVFFKDTLKIFDIIDNDFLIGYEIFDYVLPTSPGYYDLVDKLKEEIYKFDIARRDGSISQN
jgi:hypothetical protein